MKREGKGALGRRGRNGEQKADKDKGRRKYCKKYVGVFVYYLVEEKREGKKDENNGAAEGRGEKEK